MKVRATIRLGVTAAALALIAAPFSAGAENFTKETVKLLKDLKLGSEVLAGLDEELDVPKAWIEGAKKEGHLNTRITMAGKAFAQVWSVFAARYPGITNEHVRGVGRERAVVALVAFKSGKVISDVIASYEVLEQEYKRADALVRITDLPSYRNYPEELRDPDGFGVSYRLQYWCMSYNTQRVKKADLPKTWDDAVNDPRWRGAKIGLAGNVHLLVPPLWALYGDGWSDRFMTKLFHEVKPQLRKERLGGLPQLNALGEFDVGYPAGDFIVRRTADRGHPVGFHCPDVVPATTAYISMLKGNPHPNAAKLFVNWFLSKEGQLAIHRADANIPAHKDLRLPQFLPYPEEIANRRIAPNTAKVRGKTPEIVEKWTKLWLAGGGVAVEGGD